MYFRQLLLELKDLEEEGFTSSLVASHLRKKGGEISTDLRRMHQMGFLRRKRVKRLSISKKGKLCYKGYEYIYSLSKQGRSYLKWMMEQKPIEDLALIKLAKEILDHLPQELKYTLSTYVAIRSSYRYKGPNRQLGMIDKIIPIALLLSENQRLAKENFNLVKKNLNLVKEDYRHRARISDLHQVIAFYIGIGIGLNQRIEQYERACYSTLNFIINSLKQKQRKDRIDKEMMNIQNKIIEVYRNSRDHLVFALSLSLPEEEFMKVIELVSKAEKKKGWNEVEQKIEAVKAEIFK